MKIAILLAFTAFTCTPTPQPAPTPQPTPYVADAAVAPDSCAGECAQLRFLGCPEWHPTCDLDCERLDKKLAEINSATSNHSCVTKSDSCATARRCHP